MDDFSIGTAYYKDLLVKNKQLAIVEEDVLGSALEPKCDLLVSIV